MEILAAYDLTHCAESAGRLCGADPKTVARYVALREAGGDPFEPTRRPRIIDPYLEKIEEPVERSRGQLRADVVHRCHIVPMGFAGDERTTRRAVAEAKEAWNGVCVIGSSRHRRQGTFPRSATWGPSVN